MVFFRIVVLPFMDFFRIVGYTEGFRSYKIGLLAFLALCRKMKSPQKLNPILI